MICIKLEAKHSTSPAHCSEFAQLAPRGRELGAATTVDEGAGRAPWGVEVDMADAEEKLWLVEVGISQREEARMPLQRPLLQVLVAHWESFSHAALNLPQEVVCMKLLAKH